MPLRIFFVAILGAAWQVTGHAATDTQKSFPDTSGGATVHSRPEEGGPRRFQIASDGYISLYDAPSANATVVDAVTGDAVLSNLGCILKNDQIWCRVHTFRDDTRGYVPGQFLLPAIGPDGTVATGSDDSSLRARKGHFDARDHITCAQEPGQSLGECSARVARSGGGDATVVVTFSNGFARSLYFEHGMFVRANATMSGVGTDTDWRREDELHFIRVDDQQYRIPEAFIIGE